jgi:hypothetical protein
MKEEGGNTEDPCAMSCSNPPISILTFFLPPYRRHISNRQAQPPGPTNNS